MKTQEEIEKLAESIYREYPSNPLDKSDQHYNKDVNCHRKRKSFVKGYTQCQEDLSDKKYTLNDMKKACAIGIDIAIKEGENDFQPFEDLINSLNKQD